MPEALPSFKKELYEGKTAFAINSSIFDWKISTMVDFLDFYSRCKLYECLLTCKCKFISLCYNDTTSIRKATIRQASIRQPSVGQVYKGGVNWSSSKGMRQLVK